MNYLGHELFSLATNEADPTGSRRSSKLAVVSSAVGTRSVYDKRGSPARKRTVEVAAAGSQGIYELKQFILRRQGVVKPFWMGTGLADLVVGTDAAAGAVLLNVTTPQYAALFAMGVRRHLLLAGQAIQVVAATASASTTTLQLATPLLADVKAGAVAEHLCLYRFETDEVRLQHDGADFASAELNLLELPNET